MKKQDALFLLYSTVVLAFAWIIFTVIHILTSSTINGFTNQQIVAIQPTFDTKTIVNMKNREAITPAFIYTPPTASASATPTPFPITGLTLPVESIATNSSQQASTGGQTK